MEQLAIAQQIEALQQQQQQIAAQHQQYVNMGIIQPQHHLPGSNNFSPVQGPMSSISPHANSFQFPQQLQQQQSQQQQLQSIGGGIGAQTHSSTHRRNQSTAAPNVGMGPPPAPSSGASGASFGDHNQQVPTGRENLNPRGRGAGAGAGHARRHSLALPEAKKAAELAEQKRKTSGFQFPIPGSANAATASPSQPSGVVSGDNLNQATGNARATGRSGAHGRSQSLAVGNGRGSGQSRGGGNFQFPPESGSQADAQRRTSHSHARSSSRNFEGNWRQQNNQALSQDQQISSMGSFSLNQAASVQNFQPGQRQRGSMSQQVGPIGNFQYPGQAQLVQLPQGQVLVPSQMFGAQSLSQLQLAQLSALQTAQLNGQGIAGLQAGQVGQPQMTMQQQQQQQQQQRKTLFTPYLPQATLPALLGDGQLVAGILRVNKKNRSDAYVTTTDLDADIFICGSKDRNRALEGDHVAVELLDVDEVWGQKREKEEKKKRKDHTDSRSGSIAVNDATTQPETGMPGLDGGLRRRGSLRQRPTQKKNDDVEVEGQSLLLMEEDEINDEQKPLYAGHIVAVIERMAGQMFSG